MAPPRGQQLEGIVCRVSGNRGDLAGLCAVSRNLRGEPVSLDALQTIRCSFCVDVAEPDCY